jgi:hypothetical protein
MKPTALRLLAVPLSLIAFAANAVKVSWFDPITYDMSFGWGLLAEVAASMVALGIPAGTVIVLSYRRPKHFEQSPGRLAVPADPTMAGLAVLAMGIAGGFPFEAGHLAFGLTMMAIFVAGATALLVIQRPRLELDPRGLTLRDIRTVQRVEWDRLAPGGPLPPTRKRPREFYLMLDEPPVNGMFRPSLRIPAGRLYIDSAYLAERIRYYVENPQARNGIGAEPQTAALPGGGKPQGAPSI